MLGLGILSNSNPMARYMLWQTMQRQQAQQDPMSMFNAQMQRYNAQTQRMNALKQGGGPAIDVNIPGQPVPVKPNQAYMVPDPNSPNGFRLVRPEGTMTETQAGQSQQTKKSLETASWLIDSMKKTVEKDPTVVGGLTKLMQDYVAGPLGQMSDHNVLYGGRLWDWARDIIDNPNYTGFQTNSAFLVGRLLPSISGDTSGRYTDNERKAAEAALGLMKEATNSEQVIRALDAAKIVVSRDEKAIQDLLGQFGMAAPTTQQDDNPQARERLKILSAKPLNELTPEEMEEEYRLREQLGEL
jgi:hypothetical protein